MGGADGTRIAMVAPPRRAGLWTGVLVLVFVAALGQAQPTPALWAAEPALSPEEQVRRAAYPTLAALDAQLTERLLARQPLAGGQFAASSLAAAEDDASQLLHAAAVLAEERQAPHAVAFVEAFLALETGRLELALNRAERALAQQPNFPEAHALLGQTLWQQARREEAGRAFDAAIELAPSMPAARQGRALTLAAKRSAADRRAAVAELSQAVSDNPFDPFLRHDLIRIAHRVNASDAPLPGR